MTPEIPRKVQSAVDFIVKGIESGQYPAGRALPSMRALAAQAGVSLVTMFKAVARLRADGRLVGEAGRIPRVAGEPQAVSMPALDPAVMDQPPDPSAGGRIRQRLAGAIRKDILTGRYRPGTA